MEEQNEFDEIDLGEIFNLIRKNIALIIVSVMAIAIGALVFTIVMVNPKYDSYASVYLKPKVVEGVVDNNGLMTNQKLVSDYMLIMKSDKVLSPVAQELSYTGTSALRDSLSISADTNSNIIKIKATSEDAKLSQITVAFVIENFLQTVTEINEVDNIVILDEPKVNETPVSPSIVMNTIIGGMLGGILSVGYILVMFMMDKRMRTRSEVESILGVPVLGEIPYFTGE
ncbi:MAG: YveK family protein [Erysipelotrichaceae bacterium]